MLTLYVGAYAEYIAVSTHMLLHKPEHLSWEEAAGIPEVYRPPRELSRFQCLLCTDLSLGMDNGDASVLPGR
jgi:hypothetical protein